ncbi:ABC transporter ATP-binding protein [Caldisalinibacter kiritimatiensis]|uniref:ABC transporter related protein n=1 Tax=Caldisalinibacter kiritimatiensis TaxID=1304284 RepID=R1CNF7_9FIRM|nr:ABC transporter ATP-binding protein [Caldisalinibacter kiritimatiensis]EOD00246.1 ABC transporter related protein [Caldisalinibacter kiritimatiensis]
MTNTIIKLKNVSKRYGNKKVLDNVSLKLNAGELVIIKGNSGAGKTTLLNILAFLETKDTGEFLWKGQKTENLNTKQKKNIRRTEMGFIFQDFNLFENLTVEENLEVFLSLTTEMKKDEIQKKIKEYLKKFQMEDRKKTHTRFLSGGERQRVAIMRAFLINSSIVFADEPSANIDDENKRIISDYLIELKEAGKSIVIVSHDDYYDKLADKIYVLKNGNLSETYWG